MKKLRFLSNPFIALIFINFIFFFPLFFPHLKLIITPEYGGGDENIFHYPIKYLFQQKIQEGDFLFWSRKIGGGYPLFAISELGFLNPVNYLTLKFLSFPLAINTQIFIYFLILLYSSYWLGRVFKLSKVVSIFYATVFAYCFFNIANIIHLSHIASFCFIPAVYAVTVSFLKQNKIKIKYLFLLVFILSIQLFAGHQQYFYYSLLLIVLYLLINSILYKTKRKKIIIKFFLIILSFGAVFFLTLPQILPTLEYLKYSNNRLFGSLRSLSLENILTFINPFILYRSDLKNASFTNNYIPPWDSNFYFGILPLLLFILSFIKSRLTKIKIFLKENIVNIFLFFILFLLVFGKNSPLYFIYDLWPFTLFRYPERITFILLMIIILIGFLFFNVFWEKTNQKGKIFLSSIFLLNFISNIYLMYSFHSFNKPETFLLKNNFFQNFQKDNRILSPSFYESLNPYLLNKYGTKDEIFKDLILVKNSLTQNFASFLDLSSYNLPSSAINLNRHYFFYNFLFNDEKIASLTASTKYLFKMANIGYLITPYKLADENYVKLIKKIKDRDAIFYYYQTVVKPSRIYFSNEIQKITTVNDFLQLTEKDNNIIAVEKDIPQIKKTVAKPIFKFNLIKDDDTHIVIQTKNNVTGLLVLADNYYPGWKAYLDGKEVEILKANFVFRGVLITAGNHRIVFRYQPEKFYLGLKIFLITFLLMIFIYFYSKKLNIF
jgi:hypothetical protein